VDVLLGDTTKARQRLGWSAQTTFSELVRDMVFSDLNSYSRSAAGEIPAAPTDAFAAR